MTCFSVLLSPCETKG